MFALMLAAALGAGEDKPAGAGRDPAADKMALDGNWTVVCYEKNGQPVADAKDKTVSFKNNVITFTGTDEKSKAMKAMRVEFAANNMIRVLETDASETVSTEDSKTTPLGKDAKSGTYILTRDYLAVCLQDTASGTGAGGTEKPAGDSASRPQSKSYCTVILKRSDSGRSGEPKPDTDK